jgi:hypothetical protein
MSCAHFPVIDLVRTADTRLLRRMRARALSPLQGAGLSQA